MSGRLRWISACVFLVSALAVAPVHAGDRDLHDGTHDDPEMRRTVEGWRRDLDREIASIENDVTLIEGVRLYAKGTFGDVPFFALSQFGKKSDLRAYQTGRWRDRHMYAAQIEIRQKIWKRVGAAAWVGAGGVFNDFDGIFDTVLPSAGIGLRFKLTDQNPINYRIDFAWGRDQATIYFAIGEAF